METRLGTRRVELFQNLQRHLTDNRTGFRQKPELRTASARIENPQPGCERTSVAIVFGIPNTFIGLVSETGNFMAVATFSAVNASYGVHWLGPNSF